VDLARSQPIARATADNRRKACRRARVFMVLRATESRWCRPSIAESSVRDYGLFERYRIHASVPPTTLGSFTRALTGQVRGTSGERLALAPYSAGAVAVLKVKGSGDGFGNATQPPPRLPRGTRRRRPRNHRRRWRLGRREQAWPIQETRGRRRRRRSSMRPSSGQPRTFAGPTQSVMAFPAEQNGVESKKGVAPQRGVRVSRPPALQ
jgi:hypothetical protein